MTYKTPDVYIEEISVFPRSVAEVASAVPAFVGYTEKTTQLVTDDLKNVPIVVRSVPDFEAIFGKGPPLLVNKVNIDASNSFKDCDIANQYYLYDSIRLHFDNGGGKCYVVSVGTYPAAAVTADLVKGVDQVATKDEPTMLVIPDAAALDDSGLAQVQQRALNQCGDLKDRVAILDTRKADPYGEKFRDKIGINNLKYGAAYTPWLEVAYDRTVTYLDVKDKIFKNATQVFLKDLTSSTEILTVLGNRESIEADRTQIDNDLLAVSSPNSTTITGKFADLASKYAANKTAAKFQPITSFLYDIAIKIDAWIAGATPLKSTDLVTQVALVVGGILKPAYQDVADMEAELESKVQNYAQQLKKTPHPLAGGWAPAFSGGTNNNVLPAGTDDVRLDAALKVVAAAFSSISGTIDLIVSGVIEERDKLETTLMQSFGIYANIIKGVKSSLAEVPPSGAMAGVYCRVDNDRGVWKAPANVSLVSVDAPTISFTRDQTDDLNVDPVAGKSINAIREFIGKGTLVWGARTLAGNDNEWRYISVRRFFNMVEESVKKSSYFYVFEGNDANTWVKVRGMIENYLTQKWREGALAGASTKDAFYVRVGLGTTMTAQDILEGLMNVEIGMAVVRPAEFIVLKFSHKLQVS